MLPLDPSLATYSLLADAVAAPNPDPFFIVPFAALLLSIAFFPIFLKHHWERHYPKISICLGLIPVLYYVFGLKAAQAMVHAAGDYVEFIVVIASLFVTAGGIHIRVKGGAKPWVNCVFLLLGTLLGNVIGTPGASILLIRPWIRMNKYRFTGYHLPFFIFTVGNLGGALTPMGPPLFMGYLKGVPFWWVLGHCWRPWCFVMVCVLAVFYVVDRWNFLQAPRDMREAETAHERWRVDGWHQLLFIALVMASVIFLPAGIRELVMIGAMAASYFTTPRTVHEANDFTLGPLKEVAWLFAGIFATMKPALDYMALHADRLGVRSDTQFYWFSGILSGVLDNAPTYLTFLAAAFGLKHLNLDEASHMQTFLAEHGHYLIAISLGSTAFGALTYLGNGPNLMMKAIADHAKIKAPGFLEYILRYSAPVLLPIFALVWWLFIRS
jgi:Na+/H+ antiporter NhaD/arsenite permease-like protein